MCAFRSARMADMTWPCSGPGNRAWADGRVRPGPPGAGPPGPPILAPGEEFFDTEEISPVSLRRLGSSLSALQSAVESADGAPTQDAQTGFAERRKMAGEGLARWQAVVASDLPKANKALQAGGLGPLKAD